MELALIGIGAMGLPIALNLRDRGHAVRVCDINAERLALASGCTAAATPAQAAAGADAVVVCVVDAAQTEAVLGGPQGLLQALPAPRAVLLCPTIAPQDVQRLAGLLEARGIDALDAPMSGGPQRARDGTMSLMVACAEPLFTHWQPLLAQMATRLFHIGTQAGDGARTKLINNLLAAINLAGAAEAMALAERIGLDPARTWAVVEQSSGQSWIGSERLQRALAGRTEVQAQIGLLAKDSALALQMAAGAGQALSVGPAAAALFAAAVAAGWSARDDAELWRFSAGAAGNAP